MDKRNYNCNIWNNSFKCNYSFFNNHFKVVWNFSQMSVATINLFQYLKRQLQLIFKPTSSIALYFNFAFFLLFSSISFTWQLCRYKIIFNHCMINHLLASFQQSIFLTIIIPIILIKWCLTIFFSPYFLLKNCLHNTDVINQFAVIKQFHSFEKEKKLQN